jgi:hypothetical protein
MTRIRIADRSVQICVKDQTVWARDPRCARAYADLSEQTIDHVYEDVKETFWSNDAPSIAREHGYNGDVWSEGRSGGWLELGDAMYWLDYTVDKELTIPPASADADEHTRDEYAGMIAQRNKFMRFADAIDGAVKAAGEMFVQRLNEELAELDARREAVLIRGDN